MPRLLLVFSALCLSPALFASGNPLPFTWCGVRVSSITLDQRTLSAKEVSASRSCDPVQEGRPEYRMTVEATLPNHAFSWHYEDGILTITTAIRPKDLK